MGFLWVNPMSRRPHVTIGSPVWLHKIYKQDFPSELEDNTNILTSNLAVKHGFSSMSTGVNLLEGHVVYK